MAFTHLHATTRFEAAHAHLPTRWRRRRRTGLCNNAAQCAPRGVAFGVSIQPVALPVLLEPPLNSKLKSAL